MKRKRINQAGSAAKGIGVGLLAGFVFSLASAALLALMIIKGNIDEGAAGFWVILVHGGATFVSALLSGKLSRKRYLVVCLVPALLYYTILVGFTVLIFDAHLAGAGGGVVICALGAILGWLACTLRTGKKRRHQIPIL